MGDFLSGFFTIPTLSAVLNIGYSLNLPIFSCCLNISIRYFTIIGILIVGRLKWLDNCTLELAVGIGITKSLSGRALIIISIFPFLGLAGSTSGSV